MLYLVLASTAWKFGVGITLVLCALGVLLLPGILKGFSAPGPKGPPGPMPPPLPRTPDAEPKDIPRLCLDEQAFPGGSDDEPPPGALLWVGEMDNRIRNAPAEIKWSCALRGLTLSESSTEWQQELESKTAIGLGSKTQTDEPSETVTADSPSVDPAPKTRRTRTRKIQKDSK